MKLIEFTMPFETVTAGTVESNCGDITIFNATVGSIMTVDGVPVAYPFAYFDPANFGEINRHKYTISFTPNTEGSIAIVKRKIYTEP